ncbi:hypothetical protein QSV34_10570 [Porticoccus sp. W117]|uniref:hypothetical protein n=1 Tax=Porticoccus sp. W117 TaxID=3054777 RepID=UPI002591BC98|nr:hypothetical protein [Porticoccus sp. W117]MDM3871794.1 hypothetical protein [Porticoccus sp. W117]
MGILTLAFLKSADYEAFSNFMIKGHEGDFRQEKMATASNTYAANDKDDNEHAVDTLREGIDLLDRQREELQEKMRELNGVQYTDADLEATINDIIKDKDAFAAKHGLTDGEADRVEYYALVMAEMTPEEREAYLIELAQDDPVVARAISSHLELKKGERENALSQKETASTSLETGEVAAELDSSADQYVHTDGAQAPFILDM